MTAIPASVRKAVITRADGHCEVCGHAGPNHVHHRNERIHANPERSYALGHLVPGWADPADVPVQALIPEEAS
jgi:5-methylcytosine-specific restriction endonuclease McrA